VLADVVAKSESFSDSLYEARDLFLSSLKSLFPLLAFLVLRFSFMSFWRVNVPPAFSLYLFFLGLRRFFVILFFYDWGFF